MRDHTNLVAKLNAGDGGIGVQHIVDPAQLHRLIKPARKIFGQLIQPSGFQIM
jgi:hypothetical protein